MTVPLSKPRSSRRPRPYEFSVRWRREYWAEPQARLFQSAWAATRFVERLSKSFSTPGGGHVTEISVERRTVGPWLEVRFGELLGLAQLDPDRSPEPKETRT